MLKVAGEGLADRPAHPHLSQRYPSPMPHHPRPPWQSPPMHWHRPTHRLTEEWAIPGRFFVAHGGEGTGPEKARDVSVTAGDRGVLRRPQIRGWTLSDPYFANRKKEETYLVKYAEPSIGPVDGLVGDDPPDPATRVVEVNWLSGKVSLAYSPGFPLDYRLERASRSCSADGAPVNPVSVR